MRLRDSDFCPNPNCESRLWSVVKYDAPTGLFYLACDDCKHKETKEIVYGDQV